MGNKTSLRENDKCLSNDALELLAELRIIEKENMEINISNEKLANDVIQLHKVLAIKEELLEKSKVREVAQLAAFRALQSNSEKKVLQDMPVETWPRLRELLPTTPDIRARPPSSKQIFALFVVLCRLCWPRLEMHIRNLLFSSAAAGASSETVSTRFFL